MSIIVPNPMPVIMLIISVLAVAEQSSAGGMDRGSVTLPVGVVAVDGVDGNDVNNGSSWDLAKKTIQSALDEPGVSEIWIKQGEYFPTQLEGKYGALHLDFPIELYGGFTGTETERAQRSLDKFTTVINAGTAKEGSNGDHVIYIDNLTEQDDIVLDTLTLTGGSATGTGLNGAGVYVNRNGALLTNLAVIGNDVGGGIGGRNFDLTYSLIAANGGHGIRAEQDVRIIKNIIAGNLGQGIVARTGTFGETNIISGNLLSGVLIQRDYQSIHETITDNGSNGITLEATSNSTGVLTIFNTLLATNGNYGIFGQRNGNQIALNTYYRQHTLFWMNGIAPYAVKDTLVANTEEELNPEGIDTTFGNIIGDPDFLMNGSNGVSGMWTAIVDEGNNKWRLTDSGATFGELKGNVIIADDANKLQVPILENTSDSILVLVSPGSSAPASIGDSYRLADYQLGLASAAIDAGRGTDQGPLPMFDLLGVSRPQGEGYDIGAFERIPTSTAIPSSTWVIR